MTTILTKPQTSDVTRPESTYETTYIPRCDSGVLEVHLPKSEEAKAKRIAVKSG